MTARRGIFPELACLISFLGWTASLPAAASDAAPALVRVSDGGGLEASVTPEKGGELSSLKVCLQGRWVELLYRGGDYSKTTGWEGRAPWLWPATGRTFLPQAPAGELGWHWKGQRYAMPPHGFARDRAWQAGPGRAGRKGVTLVLKDGPETRKLYPFGFDVTSGYEVRGRSLTISVRVRAARDNADPMPFSIGNHITFNVPVVPGGDPKRVYITTPATRQIVVGSNGRPTGEVISARYSDPVALASLPRRSAVSLGGYPHGQIRAELRDPSGLWVRISHRADSLPSGTPVLFNLWGDVGDGFFSPEPWMGKQNSLATGDGVIRLLPGKSYTWTVTITVGGFDATDGGCEKESRENGTQ
jgi:galactose mutarotase-like enzyme